MNGLMKVKNPNSDEIDLKDFLEERYSFFNRKEFIAHDPISVPHQFTNQADIEIAAFITATIAWGQRGTLIRNATRIISLMENEPYQFLSHANEKDFIRFKDVVHRTFNGEDCIFLIKRLHYLIHEYGSLELSFQSAQGDVFNGICTFRSRLLGENYPQRFIKHVSNPAANSAAKRINMFLRWMIRKDNRKVDFGIWSIFDASQLICPLDVHSGNVARSLGILHRKQNDWQAAVELTQALIQLDANDPVKYDFALFGIGAFERYLLANNGNLT